MIGVRRQANKTNVMSSSIISDHNGWSAFRASKPSRNKIKHFAIEQWQGEYHLIPKMNESDSSFRLIWMTAGRGACMINFVRHEISRSTVCFIPPGSSFLVEAGVDSTGFVISFSRDFILLPPDTGDQEFFRERIAELTSISIIEEAEALREMEEIAKFIQREYNQYLVLRPDLLSGWLKIFLVHIKRSSRQAGKDPDLSKPMLLLKRFYALLEINFLIKKMVTQYAADLLVASRYLNGTIKRLTGHPASYHIQQRITLEAKKLAIHSNLSQKEVAYRLGFEDPGHFSKFFKKYAGQTFTEFRSQNSLSF